ncbi:hypothetical protein [Streptomyces sp. BE303]|uniref:hypothetical protein n=1 Tax=unclassified Streptomyces TaxID=2593676 RepID=UPI003FA6DADA
MRFTARPSVPGWCFDPVRPRPTGLPNPEHSITSIAELLGVSPGTLDNHIPDLQELRASRIPAQLGGGAR